MRAGLRRVMLVLEAQPAYGPIRRVELTAVVAAVVVVSVVTMMAVVPVVVVAVV